MVRTTLLSLATALALVVSTSAQTPMVFPTLNSGCPNAQTMSATGLTGGGGNVKMGVPVTFTATWPTQAPATSATLIVFGYASGGLTPWNALLPFCATGPCNMYVAPYSGVPFDYNMVVGLGDTVTLSLTVPRLWFLDQEALCVQALHADFVNGCWDMSLAYHRAIVLL